MKYILIFILLFVMVSLHAQTQKAGEGAAFILPESKAANDLGERIASNTAANRQLIFYARQLGIDSLKQATIDFTHSDFQAAISKLNYALSILKNSNSTKGSIDACCLYLAACFTATDDKGYALKYLSQISKDKNKNRDLAFGIGVIYERLNDFDQSEIYFQNSIKLDKYFKKGYYELSKVYLISNQLEKAEVLKLKMQQNMIQLNVSDKQENPDLWMEYFK